MAGLQFSVNGSSLLNDIQEVVVDFEAHTISHNDFNGIKKLLQQVLHNIHVLQLADVQL